MAFGNKFVALAFTLMALSGALFAVISVSSYTVTPTTLKPGEEGSVTFAINNVLPSATATTTDPLENVQVFFAAAPGMEFKGQSPFVVGTIGSGGSSTVTLPFKVLPSAKAGVVTATLYITQKEKTDLKTLNVAIQVVNPPIITLASDHQTILSTDSMKLTITNNGGTASKATLNIASGSSFSFIGTTQIYLGDIVDSKTVDVQIDARNAEEGVSSIPFVITYQQEGGAMANETKNLRIAVKKEKADVLFTQEGPIVSSQNDVLSLRVKNTGKRPLYEFEVRLVDEKIQVRDSKQIRLGTLGENEEREISANVFVDAQPGVRNMALELKWVEDDVEKTEATTTPIVVNSDADAAIFLDAKPSPIVSGGDHTVSILVSNVGSYKIQNVEITMEDSPAFEIFNAQRSQYIGGLESDDFSTVQYKVRVKEVAPGAYPVEISVRYKDQSGAWVEKKEAVQVQIRSKADALPKNGGDATVPIAIGALAVVAGGYWYFRMRKPKNATSQK